MKPNMDVIRTLLLTIEGSPNQKKKEIPELTINGLSEEEVRYHLPLLNDAGFIKARSQMMLSGRVEWFVERLTWQGHQFIGAAENQSRWERAKKLVLEQGGRLTLDTLRMVLLKLMQGEP